MTIARPALAAAALAAWCLYLATAYVVTLGRAHGVLSILQPWWPTTVPQSAAVTVAVFVATAGWFVLGQIAAPRRWARFAHAAVGALAIISLRVAAGAAPVVADALKLDAVRIVAAIFAGIALMPLVGVLPERARAALAWLSPAWWGVAGILLAVVLAAARLEIAVTVALNAVAWAFGAWMLRRLAAGPFGPGLDGAAAWLLGWTVLVLVAFTLGCAGLWTPSAAGLALAILSAVAWREIVAGARTAVAPREPIVTTWRPEWNVLPVAAVLIGTALVASLAPEVYSDAAGHHLALADRMAREGRLAFWPQWNATAQINHGALTFAWGTLFSSEIAGKAQNFAFALAVPLMMAAFARRWLDARAGTWAVGIWVTAGLAIWLGTTAYVDMIAAAYALGAVAMYMAWVETDRPREALLCGLFVGSLMATKFVSYSFVIPLGALIAVVSAIRWRRDRRPRIASSAAFACASLGVFLPWAVRAYLLTGNPIFPILNHVFRSAYWEATSAVGEFARLFGRPRSPAWPGIPWAMAFTPERLVEVGTVGPLLLALLPLALFARGWSRPLLRLLLVAALPTALWMAGVPYLRWFVMYLPLWALIAGALLSALQAAAPPRVRSLAVAAPFALMLVTVATDAATRSWWYHGRSEPGFPYRVAMGRESRHDYLRRAAVPYGAIDYINRKAPGARVLSPFFRDHLYEDTLWEGETASILPIRRKRDAIVGAGDPEASWRRFREYGYEYLVVDGADVHVNGPPSLRGAMYRRAFLSRFARLVFAHNGAYVFRIPERPSPDPAWPDPGPEAGNGGFELRDGGGVPHGWLRDGDVAVDASGQMAYAGRVAMRVGGRTSPTAHHQSASVVARIPIGAAPMVMVTLHARSPDAVTQGWMDVQWLDGAGQYAGGRRFPFWAGPQWDEFFFADRPPAGATHARIAIGAATPVWIDDVAFSPAPPSGELVRRPLVPAVAIYRPSESRFYLRAANRTSGFDVTVDFGQPGDLPLMGDLDGNGTATIGVYRPGDRSFHLRNANAAGPDDLVVAMGMAGDVPVVGDWDGDGVTTVGVYRPRESVFHLRDEDGGETTLACGTVEKTLQPLTGDWDADGTTGVGVYEPVGAAFLLCNGAGKPDIKAAFGGLQDVPVGGDWDGDGLDTFAVFRPAEGVLFARHSNTTGPAEIVTAVGAAGDIFVPGSSPAARAR